MTINLPDEFVEKIRRHVKEHDRHSSVEEFITDTVNLRMEIFPWFVQDICVHNENCMHWKSVGD